MIYSIVLAAAMLGQAPAPADIYDQVPQQVQVQVFLYPYAYDGIYYYYQQYPWYYPYEYYPFPVGFYNG